MATYNVTRVPPGGANASTTLTNGLLNTTVPTVIPRVITSVEEVPTQTIIAVNQVLETNTTNPTSIKVTLKNTFDSISDATAITTGNSGGSSGVAFDNVSGTVTASTTNKYRGAAGAVCSTGGVASLSYVEYNTKLRTSSSGALYGRVLLNFPSLPTSSTRVAVIADNLTAFQAEWRINTSGVLEQRSGGGVLESNSGAVTITPGQWFRLEVAILNFDATTGTMECKLFLDPNSTTPNVTLTSLGAYDTVRGGGTTKTRVGIANSIANTTVYVDDVGWSNYGYLGPSGTGSINVTANQTTETDIALPITARKIRVVEQVVETDVPQLVTIRKVKVVNQVLETDTTQGITRRKIKAVLQTTETDSSQSITKRKVRTVLQTTETDAAQIITPQLEDMPTIVAVGQATETDFPQPITVRKIKVVGQAVESDTTQTIKRIHRRTLGLPVETDTVTPIAKRKLKTLLQTTETDSALTIAKPGNKLILQATETDIAQPIRVIKRKTIGQVLQTNTALTVSRRKIRTLGQSFEFDTATTIAKPGNKLVGQTTETDFAQTIKVIKRRTLGQALESSTSLIITPKRRRLIIVNPAQELDMSTALRTVKRLNIAQVVETDIARIINILTTLPPPPSGPIIDVVIAPTVTANVVVVPNTVNTAIIAGYSIDVVLSNYSN